jgi:hypothetical protein
VLIAGCFGEEGELHYLVSQKFPHADDLEIVCWGVLEKGTGYTSQIVVFQAGNNGPARTMWQSPLDSAYSPKIRFLDEIAVGGVPIALVERQIGAAASQLDVIGKMSGRFQRIIRIDGTRFDVKGLDAAKAPFIIAHNEGNFLDVPTIYRWKENRFVEDSASHPEYYRQLLSDGKAGLQANASAIVLVDLARIAILSGNRTEAETILRDALSKEQSKGNAATKYTLGQINRLLHDLENDHR